MDKFIDGIILGHNQFFGINHMSSDKGIEREKLFSNVENVMSVIREAHSLGIRAISLNTHDKAKLIAAEIQKDPILSRDLNIYILLPYMAKYVTMANEKGIVNMINDSIKGSSILDIAKIGISGSFDLLNQNYLKMIGTLIDIELLPFKDLKIRSILLHNSLTDLLLGLNFSSVLKYYSEYIKDKYNIRPGFCSLSSYKLMKMLKEIELENQIVMAPINPIGFQMNPSKEKVEHELVNFNSDFIAMSVLAAGSVSPSQAYKYIKNVKNINSIVIGASTSEHLQSIVDEFSQYLD